MGYVFTFIGACSHTIMLHKYAYWYRYACGLTEMLTYYVHAVIHVVRAEVAYP